MKRMRDALALALALMLVLAGAGLAEASSGWREGLGPSKPYEGVPEIDLSEKLGYTVFSPTEARDVEHSCQKLFVYLPRTDVKAGEGQLHLYTEEGEELWSTAMNDTEAVTVRELTAAEQESLLWGEGTAFEVKLPRSLELGKTYIVNMERGCVWTADGKVDNPAVTGADAWRVKLVGDYGVSGAEYRRPLVTETPEPEEALEATQTPAPTETPDPRVTLDPNATAVIPQELIDLANGVTPEPTPEAKVEYRTVLKPQSGDQIRFDLVLGGEAAQAVLYGYNATVDFQQITYTQSGEVTGEVLQETPAWGVMFLDAEGNELDRVEMR